MSFGFARRRASASVSARFEVSETARPGPPAAWQLDARLGHLSEIVVHQDRAPPEEDVEPGDGREAALDRGIVGGAGGGRRMVAIASA
jgi:hypothetical protein